MHNTNFPYNFFPKDHIFLYLLSVQYTVHLSYKFSYFFIGLFMEENRLRYRYCLYPLPSWVMMNVLLMMKMMKLMTLNVYFHMMIVKLTRKKYFLIVKVLMVMKKSTFNRLILILLLIKKSPGLILNNLGYPWWIKYDWEKAEIEKWYCADKRQPTYRFLQLVIYTWTLWINVWTNKHIQNNKRIT